ncbi:hypothetical protein EJB05_26788, partial [Eragrostis curvula]
MTGEGSSSGAVHKTEGAAPRPKLPAPKNGEHITILSIDGGGIRGLIPLAILAFLEEELKEIDGEDAAIADYFDVIAGTSMGGLIAAMLAAPNEARTRPKYSVDDIEGFYRHHGPKIFNSTRYLRGSIQPIVIYFILKFWSPHLKLWGTVGWVCHNIHKRWKWAQDKESLMLACMGPKYDGKALEEAIKEKMDGLTIADTVTAIVVPTFDVKRLEPVIFSSFKPPTGIKEKKSPSLKDVCMGTTAAPTFFPAHPFKNVFVQDGVTKTEHYHLVDGGLAANNPTMVAITSVATQVLRNNPDYPVLGKHSYKKYMILSIGTSYAKERDIYTADECREWGALDWVCKGEYNPLIDMLSYGNDFLVNHHVASLFQSQDCEANNYLRIQATVSDSSEIDGSFKKKGVIPMDAATDVNMDKLYKIGGRLLGMPMARTDVTTGKYKDVDTTLNKDKLKDFAKKLKVERNLRLMGVREAEAGKGVQLKTEKGSGGGGGKSKSKS